MLRALLVFLLSLILPLVAAQDDEIVREFRKYFKKYRDTPTRVEAIRSLEGVESTEVVEALLPILKDKEPEVVRAVVEVLAGFESGPPVEALLLALEQAKNETVVLGLLRVVAEAAYPLEGELLLELLEDSSWEVRRRAAQALAALGDVELAGHLAPLCGDPEVAVRCAALEGLAQLRSELVVDLAILALDDGAWQVRSSAIAALGVVRSKRSIEPLLAHMETEEGRLVEDIGKALEALTGRGFGMRLRYWKQFWEFNGARYVLPTDAELAVLRARQAERRAQYEPAQGVTAYHGLETPSRAMLFVIDVSGSMEELVTERERFADGDYPSFSRIDIVKTELQRTIAGLESRVRFNLYSFATDVRAWKKRLVAANVLNKSSAQDWARRLEALGGSSQTDLALAGLTMSANLGAGKTNTYTALMVGLGALDSNGRKRTPEDAYEQEVDTLFFLSDGRPSHGEFVDPDDILREVREANLLRKMVIHTIAIGQFEKSFMRRLAEENGGIFVDLGR